MSEKYEKYGKILEPGILYLCKNSSIFTKEEYSFLDNFLQVHLNKSFHIFVLDVSNYLENCNFYKILLAGEIIENFYVSHGCKDHVQEVK